MLPVYNPVVIARLHGRVAAFEDSGVIVDVGGVGYRVHMPAVQLADLGPPGATVTLHTYLHVRENDMELYGAVDAETLVLFRQLLTVSGVGPRLALAILSTFDVTAVQQAIVGEDIARLIEVPGVGRRTAQRIVLDLKGKLEAAGVAQAPAGRFAAADPVATDEAEALAALLSLGYTRSEARQALAGLPADADLTVEGRILGALRLLSR
jgi:Holliday junction DNA helicase RuvA